MGAEQGKQGGTEAYVCAVGMMCRGDRLRVRVLMETRARCVEGRGRSRLANRRGPAHARDALEEVTLGVPCLKCESSCASRLLSPVGRDDRCS